MLLIRTAGIMNSQVAPDSDAKAFLTAASISDATITAAINTLVIKAKNNGWWTLCNAIYPFVGGTATTHKFNLKDPRDLDAAFRLVFAGGWTHSSTGALPNGSTANADTKLNPQGFLGINSVHLSYYSRTDINDGGTFKAEMDSSNASGSSPALGLAIASADPSNECEFASGGAFTGDHVAFNYAGPYSGWFLGSRTTSTLSVIYRNASNIGQTTTAQTQTDFQPVSIFIASSNQNGTHNSFTNREAAFISIGAGISSGLASTMYTDIQNFQTTLGRQV